MASVFCPGILSFKKYTYGIQDCTNLDRIFTDYPQRYEGSIAHAGIRFNGDVGMVDRKYPIWGINPVGNITSQDVSYCRAQVQVR